MIILPKSDINPSEITPQGVFENRRQFIQQAGVGLIAASALMSQPLFAGSAASSIANSNAVAKANFNPKAGRQKINAFRKTNYGEGEKLTPYQDVTTYNNFYEFGTSKDEPAIHSKLFKTTPWTVSIEGEVKKIKPSVLKIFSSLRHLKSASTVCDVLKAGRW